jgi:hypothetical protein
MRLSGLPFSKDSVDLRRICKELSYASPLEVGGASNQKKLKWFQLYCIAALLNLEDPKIASIRSDQREKML